MGEYILYTSPRYHSSSPPRCPPLCRCPRHPSPRNTGTADGSLGITLHSRLPKGNDWLIQGFKALPPPPSLIRDNCKGPSYCQSPTKDRLFLIYPILPSSPPYRYNSWEHFPINSAHHSPSLTLFPGNSIQGTLGLYVGHHYCHTHLVQLAFPNKPQQVNIEPRESDVRHELKLWKGGNHRQRDSSPTPGVSGAEMTWDFKSHMPPMTQDREWGEDLKVSTLSSLEKTMETSKDNGKIGKIREGGRKRGHMDREEGKKKNMEQWKIMRIKESQEERKGSWRGNKGKQITLKQAFVFYSNFF